VGCPSPGGLGRCPLQTILGNLFVLESEETPGGGSGVILGPVIGTGGTGTSTGGGGPTVAAATPRAVMAATTAVEAAAVTAAAVTAASSSSSVRATVASGAESHADKG
jgi:hypothetical protein